MPRHVFLCIMLKKNDSWMLYVFDIFMYGAMNGNIDMPAGGQYKGQGGARRSVEECEKAAVFKLHWQSELTPAGSSEKTKMVDTGSNLWLKG